MKLRGRSRANKPQSGLFSRHYYTTEYGKIASRKSVDYLENECYTIQEGLF